MICNNYKSLLSSNKNAINKHCLKDNNYLTSDICYIHDPYTLDTSDILISKKRAISCLNKNDPKCSKILESNLAKKNLIIETNMRLIFLTGILIML